MFDELTANLSIFNLFYLNDLWSCYQKDANQITLNHITLNRVWINFSIAIHEKNGVLNVAGVWRRCNSPPPCPPQSPPLPHTHTHTHTHTAGPGQSHAGGPGKFDFYSSKGHRLGYYLFIFYLEFSAVWGIFVSIWPLETITIQDFLVSWKIFICETINLTR